MTRHSPDPLLDLLDRFEAALEQSELGHAAELLEEAGARFGTGRAEVIYARACLAMEQHGLQAAAPLLRQVLDVDEDHADAHYALARVAEQQGDRETMVVHHLRVRVLDAKRDRVQGVASPREVDHVEAVARQVLSALPEPFQGRLAHVPVMLERRPSRALVEEGFDPRALGLFEGGTDGSPDATMPSRIVLFTCNLLAEYPEEPELSEQIEVTLLHEVGHFFGLDEDDMARLGLD